MQCHCAHRAQRNACSGAAALPKGIQQAQKAKSKGGGRPKRRERCCIKQCNGNAGLQQHCYDTAHIQTQLRMHYRTLSLMISLSLLYERGAEEGGSGREKAPRKKNAVSTSISMVVNARAMMLSC
jgi:hypothetical protein